MTFGLFFVGFHGLRRVLFIGKIPTNLEVTWDRYASELWRVSIVCHHISSVERNDDFYVWVSSNAKNIKNYRLPLFGAPVQFKLDYNFFVFFS